MASALYLYLSSIMDLVHLKVKNRLTVLSALAKASMATASLPGVRIANWATALAMTISEQPEKTKKTIIMLKNFNEVFFYLVIQLSLSSQNNKDNKFSCHQSHLVVPLL